MTAAATRAPRSGRRPLPPGSGPTPEGRRRGSAEEAWRVADERRLRTAARQLLAECRRELSRALAAPVPDATALLELRTEERLLQERAGA